MSFVGRRIAWKRSETPHVVSYKIVFRLPPCGYSRRMSRTAVKRRQFASDNYAGICPEAFAAMTEANQAHEVSYGNDRWTEQASNLIRDVFETNCEVFF